MDLGVPKLRHMRTILKETEIEQGGKMYMAELLPLKVFLNTVAIKHMTSQKVLYNIEINISD